MKTMHLMVGIIGFAILVGQFISMHETMAIYLLNSQLNSSKLPQQVCVYINCMAIGIFITSLFTGYCFSKFIGYRQEKTASSTTDF